MLVTFLKNAHLQVISEIIESCRAHDYTDVILVHEHRGVPDGLVICHLPFGPTAYFELLNVVSSLVILTFFGSIHWANVLGDFVC
jgi:rRNA maturation protein Rpf1